MAVLLVTHDQAEALSFADQLVVLREGRMVQAGPPRDLYLRPIDRDIATFLGDALLLPAELEPGGIKCRLGRIPASTNGRSGVVEVMLRPEQLELKAVGPDERDPGAVYGTIIEPEFSGSIWSLAVVPEGGNAAATSAPPLRLRSAALAMPQSGQRVRITVTGEAHVLGQVCLHRPASSNRRCV
jgi:iron(III) transport system ATP-binding protein